MKRSPTFLFAAVALCITSCGEVAYAFDDWIDRVDEFLTVSAFDGRFRARLSGLADLEGYYVERPAPGLIFSENRSLINPRLTLFLDTQIGSHVYAFAQARVDRGFDPNHENAEVRLDEYAIRVTPWEDGRFSLQVGKFGTVVGSWVQRHYSWENPFITAPAPYENLTGIWDSAAPGTAETLLFWGGVHRKGEPPLTRADVEDGNYLRVPVLWGPSYASGIAVFGKIGKVEYAAEVKNSALSSRPESWDVTEVGFEHPTFSTRFGFRPNAAWNLGLSASSGAYLLPEAEPSLPPGKDIGDYRELVLGQDISFEWHHLQLWAEFYEARFEVPEIGNADVFAYYVEAKYKLTTQLFGALRWNEQLYGTIRDDGGGRIRWGNDLWRIDAALGYRFSPHTQLKVQYSLINEDSDVSEYSHLFSGQLTLRF